jgi:DNA-binding CsgD family transcriptional regulator/PAS domain-containing protein
MWNVFLRQMADASGITKAALLAHDLEAGDHRMLATVGDTVSESVPLYESHYYQFDEWTARFAKHARAGRFVEGEELWPEASLRTSVFFNEFLKPFDVCQMAAFAAIGGQGRFEALSVYRGPREYPFESDSLALLQMLVPHLETALSTRRRLAQLETRITDLDNALNQLPAALVLLNSSGRCVLVNEAAKAILDQRNGLYMERSMLFAKNPTESSRLREALGRVISLVEGRGMRVASAVNVSRLGRKPLSIVASPFNSGTAAGQATAIVFINDPEQKAALPTEVLRMLFGLTTSEARLAITLLEGNSLSEAAQLHEVGQETVRSQVKNIFQKTGTKRQGELMQMLTALTCPRL